MILGYLVNYQKSRIQFSNGASNAEKKKLQIPISNKISTYLGCINIDQRKKRNEDFGYV